MRQKPTVADLRALKGKGQRTMLRVMTLEEAAAAEAAGIDIVSVPAELVTHPHYRRVAPTLFSMTGRTHLEAGTRDDYLRWACEVMNAGADAVYCSGSLATVEHVAREHIPVVGHVGLVPSRATWTGGFKAVGKTAEQALALYHECRAYEAAGAFAVEIEVVPVEVATAISARLNLLLWSMGAGAGCDAQYLFACDILGAQPGPHAAALQGLPRLRRRVRSAASGARRRLPRIHRRCRLRRLPGRTAPRPHVPRRPRGLPEGSVCTRSLDPSPLGEIA